MKKYFFYLITFTQLPFLPGAQVNVGIGGDATRARLEVFGIAGTGNTSAVFGSDGAGISFQRNWPTVGFNQYRSTASGNGSYMHGGYAAVEYMDPVSGTFALDMQSVAGVKDGSMGERHRAFTIFPSGAVSFGKGTANTNFTVDYLNFNNTNTANGTIHFYGTQYASFIHGGTTSMPTQIGPGKDNGVTYINDVGGNNVVIGNIGTKVGINVAPLYLTTLSIRHAQAGNGLLLRDQSQTTPNNWEWYVSNDFPLVWLGQKFNGALIGDYNPETGEHGTTSDRRLKKHIRPLRSVLDDVMQLQPVQYRMKTADPGSLPVKGFIAQHVKKLFPELVLIINDSTPGKKTLPDLHMMNYSQFFVLAVKAIQEQQGQIAALNKEIIRLEQSNQ
ncbi:MAG: tail fiber domain-containing protein [Bacteroidota bacterium]